MVFVQKRRLSAFSPWLIMERVTKLAWPLVTDLKIPRYTFYRYCYRCQSQKKFQGDRLFRVVMTNIQTFSEARSRHVTWWSDLEWHGWEIFRTCAEKGMNRCAKRSGAPDDAPLEISAINLSGVFVHLRFFEAADIWKTATRTKCSFTFSAHVKIADPGHSRSGHQVTSWPHLRKRFNAHHSYTDWLIDRLETFGDWCP